MRRDGDRLTRSELKTAQQRLNGETVNDRSALQRLRGRQPPSPEDVVRWNVQEALVLEKGHRVWGSQAPGAMITLKIDGGEPISVRRPPRVLEAGARAMVEEMASRGSARYLNFLDGFTVLLDELKRIAEEDLPLQSFPPGIFEGEGAGDRLVLYSCLRGRNRGEEPVRTVEEYLVRAQVEGYEEQDALDTLHAFRDEGLVVREDGTREGTWLTWPLDTPIRLVEIPAARAGRIVSDTLDPTARVEGETD